MRNDQYLYIARFPRGNYVKVGISNNPPARMAALGGPKVICLFAPADGRARVWEKELLARLAPYRARGDTRRRGQGRIRRGDDWFPLCPVVTHEIEDCLEFARGTFDCFLPPRYLEPAPRSEYDSPFCFTCRGTDLTQRRAA